MIKACFIFILLAMSCGTAFCQTLREAPYLDDRSDAVGLVRSFYSAVSRHEYARAWSYFGQVKPTRDFATFVDGFKNTAFVTVITGDASREGAAGSTYFNLPVAIVATRTDGGRTAFAGCYVARLANPQNQQPPFAGLSIERAELKGVSEPAADHLPTKCGDGPEPPASDRAALTAKTLFAADHAADCPEIVAGKPVADPEIRTIVYKGRSSQPSDPDLSVRLFVFRCEQAAYNESHVYYLDTGADGVHELLFATPELDIRYSDGNTDGKLESVTVIGFTAIRQLVNSSFDESTLTIRSFDKWRGVGDASTAGTWIFRDGAFALVNYDVDASYDGEMNPQTVVDYNTPP